MTPLLQKILLITMAIFILAMVVQALRSGKVNWRNGALAADRLTEPVRFWLWVGAEAVLAVFVAALALR